VSRASISVALLALSLALPACNAGRSAPDIALKSDSGATWQLSRQRGKAVLLTFGFTHCADTCPAILGNLMHVTAALGARSREVEVAFVTVDPARDSPAVLHRFVGRFVVPGAGEIVGLTGTPAQIARTQAAYHVWSRRLPSRHKNYDVAHLAAIFFIDANGRLRAVRDEDDSQQALRQTLAEMLG
jgi:protein SCO1